MTAGRAEAGLPGPQGRGGAVGHVEFQQHLGDMVAHGLVRHGQPSCDLVVPASGGQQVQDLPLAWGQVGERPDTG